jgi:hypothetical protein
MSDRPNPEIQVLGPGVVVLTGAALVETMHLVGIGLREAESRGSRHLGAFRFVNRTLRRACTEAAELSRTRQGDTTYQVEPSDSERCEDSDLLSDYFGSADAAKALGVTVRTVQRQAPELGGFFIGHRWVFDRSLVLARKAFRDQRNEERNAR